MTESSRTDPANAVDAVVLWVNGDDPVLAKKRQQYLDKNGRPARHVGALPTFFASSHEIRYSVLSMLRFAPFLRHIYIVTDGQDPGLDDDLERYFPHRRGDVRIVDHSEIFRGYEAFLPSFNSATIHSMIWRIRGLADRYIYFNDDLFLVRDTRPEDWFREGRPVLRGRWKLAPWRKILSNAGKTFVNRTLRGNREYEPRLSFYLRQWRSARLAGMWWRYFFHCHSPSPMDRRCCESLFEERGDLLEMNLRHKFRHREQFLLTSMALHVELQNGNRNLAPMNHGYLHPHYSRKKILRKFHRVVNNPRYKSMCVQSMEMMDKEVQEEILAWMDEILGLDRKT